MGLTVHYNLRAKDAPPEKALALMERVRQLAMDLPFDCVGEMRTIADPAILNASIEDLRENCEECFWEVLDSTESYTLPWSRAVHRPKTAGGGRGYTSRSRHVDVRPTCIVTFHVEPAEGAETALFSLARYPSEISVDYRACEDVKYFRKYVKDDWGSWDFDFHKYHTIAGRGAPSPRESEQRRVKTRLGGWRGASFCKTQYASNPKYGGVANFLKGHIALITLLDRAAKIPGLAVTYNDEGRYGTSHYTDDYTVESPVYYKHAGKYSVAELAREIGEWNGMLAAFAGALKGALNGVAPGASVGGEIYEMANFEQLEFRGASDPRIKPFLETMVGLARAQKVDDEV